MSNNIFRRGENILKVKGKLSYIYGHEALINYESVFQALIRDQTLEIVMEPFQDRRAQGLLKAQTLNNKQLQNIQSVIHPNNFVYFWKESVKQKESLSNIKESHVRNLSGDHSNRDENLRNIKANEAENSSYLYSGDCRECFKISFKGWKNLYKLIEYICDPKVEINDQVKAELFSTHLNIDENIIKKTVQSLREDQKQLMKRLSDKIHHKSNVKNPSGYCLLMFQIMIYVGPKKVGHSNYYPIFMMQDNERFNKVLEFKLAHNEENFQYAFLPFEARLGVNVWALDIDKQAVCLGSAGSTIFEQDGRFKTGYQKMVFWPLKPFPSDISCYG